MTSLTCVRVVALLERREVGLSESERLRAESHLTECAECREQSRLLDGARRALRSASQPNLSSSTRELVLRRAFEQSAQPQAEPPMQSAARLRPMLLVAAAVLVAGGLSWAFLRAPSSVAARGGVGDAVEQGQLSSDSGVLEVDAHVPPGVPLETKSAARLHVSNAQVDATAGTRIIWRPRTETLGLSAGSVKVSVDHVEGRHFRVAAPDFVVEVVGTEFEVDRRGVRVTRGTVRVLGLDGKVLAVLPAGGAWSAAAPSVPSSTAPSGALGSAAAASGSEPVAANVPAAPIADEPSGAVHAAPAKSLAELLASARHNLAKGKADEAEKLAQAVLGQHPGNRDAAEARTLLAECAVARGNTGRAISLYLDVARAYSILPAGDNALFAAARLSERSGSKARAHELFERYLRQYPAGRFRSEAERHLRPASTPTSTKPG